ncbi:hypothetical protein ABVN80_17845 [Acinetobacter baumannii]
MVETIQQLTTRFIDAMNEDAANFRLFRLDEASKATEYILTRCKNMIGNLVNKGAYLLQTVMFILKSPNLKIAGSPLWRLAGYASWRK